MLLMRNFFMAIPIELSEAARIDGTSEIRLFVSIILPLSMPILATIALFYGVGRWNEYSNVIIYNSKNDMQTLQVIIRRMYEQSRLDDVALEGTIMPPLEAIRAATVIFSTVPILCVYPFLQKYFAQGLMVGSVKG
jgi:putative aldouronate transport system permease protein